MKLTKSLLKCLVFTSLAWLTFFFLLTGGHRNAYFHGKMMYLHNFVKPPPPATVLGPLPPEFAAALQSMYAFQPQRGTDGLLHSLDKKTKIAPWEGRYIYELCRKVKPKQTLEIGLAYGYSTIFFLAAIKANGMGSHVALDPFEITDWHGIALKKAEELGMQPAFRFIPQFSALALPGLVQEGQKYEVIFIDGSHRFEDALLDFTLSAYLCPDGGYIIFHDALDYVSVRKAVAFVERNRPDFQRQATDALLANLAVFRKTGVDSRKDRYFADF